MFKIGKRHANSYSFPGTFSEKEKSLGKRMTRIVGTTIPTKG
jgi:hypothetical protein